MFVMLASLHCALAVDYDYSEQGGVRVVWHYDDMCGVYTSADTEIIHWVTDGGDSQCTLSSYGWSLTSGSDYCAYFPYAQAYATGKHPKTALPIAYGSQLQTQNGDMAHLSACDYMTAQTTSVADACHFAFQHLGSILRFRCRALAEQTLTSLTIAAPADAFVLSATMNVADGTLTPVERTDKMQLALADIAVQEGDSLVAYMMVAPVDLSADTLTVTLADAAGTALSVKVQGAQMLAGRVYDMALDMPELEETAAFASVKPEGACPQAVPKTAAVQAVTAFAPAFTHDDEHRFEQIVEEEPPSSISSRSATDSPQQVASYDLGGSRTSGSAYGRIIITNGTKRITNRY